MTLRSLIDILFRAPDSTDEYAIEGFVTDNDVEVPVEFLAAAKQSEASFHADMRRLANAPHTARR